MAKVKFIDVGGSILSKNVLSERLANGKLRRLLIFT